MTSRLFAALVVLTLVIAGCSSAAIRPAEFDGMETGRVGCTAVVGDDPVFVFFPLGSGETQTLAPTDGFSIRIEQRKTGVVATVIEYSGSKGDDMVTSVTKGWSDLPTDGKGAEVIRVNLDGGHTRIGYIVRCWKGEG